MHRLVLTVLYALSLSISPRLFASEGIALGYVPKYPAHFQAFDYVNPDAPQGGMLTLAAMGSYDTLNPFTLKGDKAEGIAQLTCDTLAERSMDEPFSMYGLLAEDITLAPDGLSVTFRLRSQARFFDGSPVLARDVQYSFNTLTQDPAAHPRYALYWADVRRSVVLGPRIIRFDFNKPNSELHMTLGELPVFSQRWAHGTGLAATALTPPYAAALTSLATTNSAPKCVFNVIRTTGRKPCRCVEVNLTLRKFATVTTATKRCA